LLNNTGVEGKMETTVDKNAETNKQMATQLSRNVIVNIFFFGLNMFISMWIVPYYVANLGKDAYSYIGLITSLTAWVAIIIVSLNTAISRYLTMDLQKGDYQAANKTFNTAVIGLSALILIMSPILLTIGLNITHIVNILPDVSGGEVIWLVLGVFAASMINMSSGNFTVQLFALNRLDLQVIVNSTLYLSQNGLVILFFHLYHPSLIYIGMAYPIGAIITAITSITLARRVCPYLKLSISSFDFTQLRTLFNMSSWTIVNQLGALLFTSIDMYVINRVSTEVAGPYTTVLQLATLLKTMAALISGMLTPIVYTYYAKKQTETLVKMAVSAVKLMGIFIALPIGLLCGLSTQVLTIWLTMNGKIDFVPGEYNWLLVLMAFHLAINLSVLPLFAINVAYNRVKTPGIVTLIMGIGNFTLAFALPLLIIHGLNKPNIAFYGVAGAGAIVLTLKNTIFTPWYTGKIMGIKPTVFLKSMITGVTCTALVTLISFAAGQIVTITSFATLIPIGGAIGLIYILLAWKFALSPFERAQFKTTMPRPVWAVLERI